MHQHFKLPPVAIRLRYQSCGVLVLDCDSPGPIIYLLVFIVRVYLCITEMAGFQCATVHCDALHVLHSFTFSLPWLLRYSATSGVWRLPSLSP